MKRTRNKVLIITAHLGLVDRIGKLLAPAGFELHHAWNHEEGRRTIEGNRFDVVLLHVGMPDSHGFTLFVRANLQLGQPAMIVIAEHHDEGAMTECLRLGAQDFISIEDLDSSLIAQRVRHAMERNRFCQDRLGAMELKLLHAEERERRRFAVELHDQLGHNLAAASLKLAMVAHMVHDARDLVEDAVRFTRTVTYSLGSPLITEAGLVPAIEWLVDEQRKCHDMRFEMHDDGLDKPLDINMSVLLYQAVRELLVNVVKHADASHAVVSIARRDQVVHLDVTDDGVGFDETSSALSLGFGLHSIRERMEFMGGGMTVDSGPGPGTRVRLIAPLSREQTG
jgi:signal transduction histidine kinase